MSIAERLNEIEKDIADACARADRSREGVHLLAVSKLQPIESIEEAYAAGVRDFGENYVQELLGKKQSLSHLKDIRWHLIGHLQGNKAKQVVGGLTAFHALDSLKLASEIAKRAKEALPVFIEVNVDHERTKAGVSPEHLPALVAAVKSVPDQLKLEGLMCIPEHRESPELMRPAFRRLANLAREFGSDGELKLSMGMSEDFPVAIEEGAHWVRVGRRLFGDRPAKK